MKTAHHQWKRFLSCMPPAADGTHGGDVGLAAQAAATRGLRPNGLSPPLRRDRGPLGLSLHINQPWVVITTLSCAAGTIKPAPAGAFVSLGSAMPDRLLGGFTLFCFRAQITLPLHRFQARQQDSTSCRCEPLRTIKTPKQWMDASSAHAVVPVMRESRVVTCGPSRL